MQKVNDSSLSFFAQDVDEARACLTIAGALRLSLFNKGKEIVYVDSKTPSDVLAFRFLNGRYEVRFEQS